MFHMEFTCSPCEPKSPKACLNGWLKTRNKSKCECEQPCDTINIQAVLFNTCKWSRGLLISCIGWKTSLFMKYLEQEISLWTEIILCITGLSNTKPVKTQNCTEIHPPCYYNAALTVIIPQRLSKRRDTTSHVEYQKSYLKCRKWNVTESFSDKWKKTGADWEFGRADFRNQYWPNIDKSVWICWQTPREKLQCI